MLLYLLLLFLFCLFWCTLGYSPCIYVHLLLKSQTKLKQFLSFKLFTCYLGYILQFFLICIADHYAVLILVQKFFFFFRGAYFSVYLTTGPYLYRPFQNLMNNYRTFITD